MAFSVPRNAPRFNDDQRQFENVYWHSRNPPPSNGITSSINGMLGSNGLPMYKDKPFYKGSRRYIPYHRRKRVWSLGAVTFVAALFWLGLLSTLKDSLLDLVGSGPKSRINWDIRRESVRTAFKLSWDAYERHGWGMDEYYPVSQRGQLMTQKGVGWIIVDALDTLMIMNLTTRLQHARSWVATSLTYDQDHDISTFETTIRMLGGLLGAHYLSTEFPELAPLEEDNVGKPGEDLYLEKAADLADRLLGAFDSKSGLPYASVNLHTLQGIESHEDEGASSTAEAGSLQLEFKYLAMLMGEKLYWERAEKVIQVIDDNGAEDGLVPIYVFADSGKFRGRNVRLGSRGDSYYEYLIKQYLQTSKQEPIYLDMWREALAGVRKHLLTYSKNAHFTILGERPDGLHGQYYPKMDHLVCFMPGTIALAATGGRPLSEARKSKSWTARDDDDMALAIELMKTCWAMYKVTATGLAAEITHFEVGETPRYTSSNNVFNQHRRPPPPVSVDWHATPGTPGAAWMEDLDIHPQDSHNLQRPETVESLLYMYRITGDEKYRHWGWEMFSAFVQHTALDNGAGFTSLQNANVIPPVMRDNMESFWLAETLKYFYLLFSEKDFLPLDKIVFNTEAHPLPRFRLQRGLKTGWTRKARDEVGRMVGKVDEVVVAAEAAAGGAGRGAGKPAARGGGSAGSNAGGRVADAVGGSAGQRVADAVGGRAGSAGKPVAAAAGGSAADHPVASPEGSVPDEQAGEYAGDSVGSLAGEEKVPVMDQRIRDQHDTDGANAKQQKQPQVRTVRVTKAMTVEQDD